MPGPLSSTWATTEESRDISAVMRTAPPLGIASSALPIRLLKARSMRLRSSGTSISGGISSAIVTPCWPAAWARASQAAQAAGFGCGVLAAGDVEQVLQELLDTARGAIDVAGQALDVGGREVGIDQHLGAAVDGGERVAQVVDDRAGEAGDR